MGPPGPWAHESQALAPALFRPLNCAPRHPGRFPTAVV